MDKLTDRRGEKVPVIHADNKPGEIIKEPGHVLVTMHNNTVFIEPEDPHRKTIKDIF
jgi:hypothetical protein